MTDISRLAGLHGLRKLDLCGCRGVTDLSALSGLVYLESLSFDGTQEGDLSVFSGFLRLRRLHVDGTPVTDLSRCRSWRTSRT